MADAAKNFNSSGQNMQSGSGEILAKHRGETYVSSFTLVWGNVDGATGAYLYNYTTINNGSIDFYINGTKVGSATYNGSNSRPSVSWSGSLTIPSQTAVTISFQPSTTSDGKYRAMRNEFRTKITYTVQAHPTVSAGSIITNAQIKALNYYINGNNTGPGQGVVIKPYVIGSAGSKISASTYNNA